MIQQSSGSTQPLQSDFYIRVTKDNTIKSAPFLGKVYTLMKTLGWEGLFKKLAGDIYQNEEAVDKLASKTTESNAVTLGHIWKEATLKRNSGEVYTKLASKSDHVFQGVLEQYAVTNAMAKRMAAALQSWSDLAEKIEELKKAPRTLQDKLIQEVLDNTLHEKWRDIPQKKDIVSLASVEKLWVPLANKIAEGIKDWAGLITTIRSLPFDCSLLFCGHVVSSALSKKDFLLPPPFNENGYLLLFKLCRGDFGHLANRFINAKHESEDALTTIIMHRDPHEVGGFAKDNELLNKFPNLLTLLARNAIESRQPITFSDASTELGVDTWPENLQKAFLEQLCTPEYREKMTDEDFEKIARDLVHLAEPSIASLNERRKPKMTPPVQGQSH